MANKVFVEFEVDDSGALKKITAFNGAVNKLSSDTKRNFQSSGKAAQKAGSSFDIATGKVQNFGKVSEKNFRRASSNARSIGSSFDIATGKVTNFTTKATRGAAQSSRAFSTFAGTLTALATSKVISVITQQLQEAVQLAVAFDKALIGVEKTTGLTGRALDTLGKRTVELSKRIPKAADELLNLQKVAGQLGVRGADNLLRFAETMVRLEESTDISGEAGAQSILRILNITDEGVGSIEQFGSAISFLGNNFNIMESQIVESGSAIATATSRFNLSSADILGLATATVELGLQTRVSGSTIGRTFREIQNSIRDGGKSFETLQKITGLTGAELKETFGRDAVKVFDRFIAGASKVENISALLAQFNLEGEQIERVIPSLAKKSDRLTMAINDSNRAFSENVALVNESEKAFSSLEARADKVDNRIAALTKDTGTGFAEFWIGLKERIADTGEEIGKISDKFDKMFPEDLEAKLASVTARIDQQRKALAEQEKQLAKVKEEGDPEGFAALIFKDAEAFEKEISKINQSLEKMAKLQGLLREQTFVGPPEAPVSDEFVGPPEEDLAKEDDFQTKKNQIIINKRMELAIAIQELEQNIANEDASAREELIATNLELEEEERAEALGKLQEFEDQKIIIARDAALLKADIIENEEIKRLEKDKIRTEAEFKQSKLNAQRSLKFQATVQNQELQLRKQNDAAKLGLAKSAADAALALTGDNQIAALAIGKAFAVADVFVKDGQARAAASLAAFSAGASAGPGAPAVIATLLASFNAAITTTTALSLGTIAAQTVASVARFQTGGIVKGPQVGDQNFIRADGGEGMLTREGVRAIADINQGNTPGGGETSSTTVIVENFIGEESFIDDLIEQLNDAQENRNQRLEARGNV